MCGISGIVNFSVAPVNHDELLHMTSSVAHRGPDGSGMFCERNLGMGHRRLSIVDLSDASAQPMQWHNKYVIVYNGEIYNFPEVRKELENKGYQFNTSGDTEVILAAYDFWKADCVSHFNGMWAFAIYDREKKILFCSRDRFGVKPFYYSISSIAFKFGSEIRQLINADINTVNLNVLANYVVLGLEEYNEDTFFDSIKKLPAGHNLVCNLQSFKVEITKYYTISLNREFESLTLQESTKLFLSELKRSVSYRLRSDVKVGTCLSGGLDSSTIAAIASELLFQQSGGQFTAITASSEDSGNDETGYAKLVAQKSNLDWNTIMPTKEDFSGAIEDVIKTQEEPFGGPSVFMQYFVMKKARECGCPVLLDGQGGDETLLGYNRYFPSYLMSLKGVDKITGLLNASKNTGHSVFYHLKNYLYFTNSRVRLQRQKFRSAFLHESFVDLISRELIEKLSHAYRNIRDLQILELTTTQLPHLLKYEDKNSMRFSIETRLPFLDYKLVELSLSLNNAFKIRKGYSKYILRKASESVLPNEISWRKNKKGFEAPTDLWLNDTRFMHEAISGSTILNGLMKNKPAISVDNVLLWRLYNIAKWEEVFNVR